MKTVLSIIGALILGALTVFAINGVTLANLSFWGPTYEDARRSIVQRSLRRQEGVSENIGALCLNMRLEQDGISKSAFANLIVQQATATGTELTPDAESCKREAQAQLNL